MKHIILKALVSLVFGADMKAVLRIALHDAIRANARRTDMAREGYGRALLFNRGIKLQTLLEAVK